MSTIQSLFKKGIIMTLILILLICFSMPDRTYAQSRAVVAHCNEYITLRKTNSTNADAITRIPLGEEVTVLSYTSNGFAKVQYFAYTGFVLDKYLEPWKETNYKPLTKTKSGYPVYCGNYGTAKRIERRTVVVAIYANDATTSWNFKREADIDQRLINRKNMSIACTWLTEQARRYKSDPGGFAWDWRDEKGLYYEHTFSEDILKGEGQAAIRKYINSSIPTKDLLEKFKADNIIYCVYLNAPNSDDYRSWCCMCDNSVAADKYQAEICVFVPYGRGRKNPPAVFAHEMLHCFGAYDLYETDSGSPITQKYVDHLMSNQPNDLMNHCFFSDYDLITNVFSDVDAYYVGLTGPCADVKKWGLGKSQFERFEEN